MKLLPILVASLLFPAPSPGGLGQRTVLAALQPSATRQRAPSFKLRDAAGKKIALSDFGGKPVILNIWATECGGCRTELPGFVELDRVCKDQGVAVIGISMDVTYENLRNTAEAWAKVTPFAREHGLAYTLLVDDGSVEKAYNVTAIPATYLIDKRGRIAATYLGVVDSADVETNVRALIAESN
jgi:peroxiredoxin